MTTSHTPGPWVYRYDPVYQYGRFETVSPVAAGTDPVVIAVREDWTGYLDATVRGQANARLIDAAPDLLEALRDIVASAEKAGVAIVDLAGGRFAIAKAEGREP